MKPDELKDRTKQFALRVIKLVAALPKTIEGRAEADETLLWPELISEANLLPPKRVDPLLAEANELVAIMAASRRSASANLKSAI